MVFSSIVFLFRFMPIVFAIYYITPTKLKNTVLFLVSLFFYGWGEFKYLPIILFTIFTDWIIGLLIDKYRGRVGLMKLFLVLSIIKNMGILVFFKYSNFFIENFNLVTGLHINLLNIVLPVGISFYTFQTQAYTIDVYRNDCEVEHNFINYGAYVTLFPQLVAGPIVRYSDVQKELRHRTHKLEDIQKGVFTFIMGLGSKVLIANNIGGLWDSLAEIKFQGISSPLAWLGAVAFGLQIYFDFSGYSLMAIGMGKMLGFNFPDNFNYPYISKSITEFWRRWHMTLGTWFREYVYIPLGGNRVSPKRQIFNIFVVWALTGFWHGASWNFILWGLYFFVFLVIEKKFLLKKLEKSKVIGHIYLLLLITVSWVLFQITDFSLMKEYFVRMFSFQGGTDWIYYLRNYGIVLLLAIVLSMPILPAIGKRITKGKTVIYTIFAAIVLFFSVAYLVDSTYNPFLYFRF